MDIFSSSSKYHVARIRTVSVNREVCTYKLDAIQPTAAGLVIRVRHTPGEGPFCPSNRRYRPARTEFFGRKKNKIINIIRPDEGDVLNLWPQTRPRVERKNNNSNNNNETRHRIRLFIRRRRPWEPSNPLQTLCRHVFDTYLNMPTRMAFDKDRHGPFRRTTSLRKRKKVIEIFVSRAATLSILGRP